MQIVEEFIGDIPILMVYKSSEIGKFKGTILFYHGLESNKEKHIDVYKRLAQEGFYVVGVDSCLHGKRRPDNFSEIFTWDNLDVWRLFLNTVYETACEIPTIIDYLVESKISHPEHIGIAGVSMGGYITYTAITLDPRIKVAAPLIGSPHYHDDREESPERHIEQFEGVYLLSQTGGLDTTVPPLEARKFHVRLEEAFPYSKQRYKYIEYPESEHSLREEDWFAAIDEMAEWFKRYL